MFLVDERKEDENTCTTKTGHHRPASETPFKWRHVRWRADDDQTWNSGLVAL